MPAEFEDMQWRGALPPETRHLMTSVSEDQLNTNVEAFMRDPELNSTVAVRRRVRTNIMGNAHGETSRSVAPERKVAAEPGFLRGDHGSSTAVNSELFSDWTRSWLVSYQPSTLAIYRLDPAMVDGLLQRLRDRRKVLPSPATVGAHDLEESDDHGSMANIGKSINLLLDEREETPFSEIHRVRQREDSEQEIARSADAAFDSADWQWELRDW
ncbi:hypothetical protein OAS39_06085 [Pirellulales bacterium]|nr:hypothetical protein [Pirellulales bacterium]